MAIGVLPATSAASATAVKPPLLLALNCQMVALVAALLLGSFQESLLWVHPFGPLTKNVPWLLGTLVVLWLSKENRAHER